jgi:hypothetical protein
MQREMKKKNESLPEGATLSVWAFDYSRYLERLPGSWEGTAMLHPDARDAVHLVTAPRASNPNLHAQDGVFTLFRPARVDMPLPPDRRSLDELVQAYPLEQVNGNILFREFTLHTSEASLLMRQLSQIGVNAATLFPGYGGVVRTLQEEL